jgi:hypothetical protein
MRFARPVTASTIPVVPIERRGYTADSPEVPVPAPLQQYVRGPVHFAMVLGALTGRAGYYGRDSYHGARLKCAQDILRRFLRNLNDPIACDLLLLLFPPVPCGYCAQPFLCEGARREYCGDRCRRAASWRATKERQRAAVAS